MNEFASFLKQTDLFANLPEEIISREILPHGKVQEIPKGQFLIVPQQRTDRFGIILSGKVHIMHIFYDGNYSLMTALHPKDVLWADVVCTKSRISPYHTIAATSTRILYFPIELLIRPGMMHEAYRLDAVNRLLTLISNENMKKEYRLAILSQKGLRERIVTYLTMQAGRLRKNTFSIAFSREELASFLCVNRSALSHELSLMQQEGLISFHKNVFTLLNLDPSQTHASFGI